MTEVSTHCIIESIKNSFDKEQIDEILDEDGNLRSCVDIIDSQTKETIYSGAASVPIDWKTPAETDYEKRDVKEKEEELRGDYLELKAVLNIDNRYDMLEHLRHVDRRRIVLIREHLLQLLAYENRFETTCVEIINIITRLMSGDVETDSEMENTIFDLGDIEDC